MWTKDKANRARWSRDQRSLARQNMAADFARERSERISGLRSMIAHCDIDPQADAMFGADARAELARLEN